ncbi:hypothetical protein BGZ98_000922 [Dissophora globulifera]|nr:hypothetical protein BGZ98_000922 [Dissophora globulifera]
MSHNFGTDMPTTVDLKSAIDTCDVLCKFALHFASQDPKEMEARAANEGQPIDPHHRSNLQIIRNMNSTMLAGLQPSGAPSGSGGPGNGSGSGRRREDDGEELPAGDNESPWYQQQQQQQQYRRSTDAPMTDSADQDDDDDDDETSPIFGMGPPSSELVHELAKAATSIFQLAIRIKAWVSMTPEQRERDEEINIIRGKRCLFMDGTATMPLPSVDAHSARRQHDEWVSNSQTGGRETTGSRIHPNESSYGGVGAGQQQQQQNRFQGPGDFVRMDGAMTNGRSTSQFSTPFGSYTSIASSQGTGGGGMASSMMLMEKGLGRVKSRTSAKATGSENGEAPYPKYRKRAKRTHPPGRCLSCDSSDTPEWRRGPDGARTLCNACGLHYAKLLKRQQQQQALQNGAQDAAGSNTVTTAALRLSMAQLQGNFQNRRRPDSLTQGEGVINGAGGEAGASDAITDSNMVVDQDTLQQAPQAPPPTAD